MDGKRLLGPILLFVTLATGCQRALFVDDNGRTQFDSFNLIRQRSVPVEEPDVFGNPRPALRARLTQTR